MGVIEDGGSETGCGRVWTGVRMEDGVSETGCGRVWTGVRMEDGGERDGRGARRGVDGCGRG